MALKKLARKKISSPHKRRWRKSISFVYSRFVKFGQITDVATRILAINRFILNNFCEPVFRKRFVWFFRKYSRSVFSAELESLAAKKMATGKTRKQALQSILEELEFLNKKQKEIFDRFATSVTNIGLDQNFAKQSQHCRHLAGGAWSLVSGSVEQMKGMCAIKLMQR